VCDLHLSFQKLSHTEPKMMVSSAWATSLPTQFPGSVSLLGESRGHRDWHKGTRQNQSGHSVSANYQIEMIDSRT